MAFGKWRNIDTLRGKLADVFYGGGSIMFEKCFAAGTGELK